MQVKSIWVTLIAQNGKKDKQPPPSPLHTKYRKETFSCPPSWFRCKFEFPALSCQLFGQLMDVHVWEDQFSSHHHLFNVSNDLNGNFAIHHDHWQFWYRNYLKLDIHYSQESSEMIAWAQSIMLLSSTTSISG